VVTASYDQTARLWDAAGARELQVLRGHGDKVFHAAFSPNGRTVVTASRDRTTRLWDAATGRELQVLRGHEGEVDTAAFSPDGRTVVTASRDRTARLWRCEVFYPLKEILELAEQRQSRDFTLQERQRYLP
jgi:WD40 repeat protein